MLLVGFAIVFFFPEKGNWQCEDFYDGELPSPTCCYFSVESVNL